MVLTVAVAIANVLGASMTLPQVLRFRRTRDVRGVSAPWLGAGVSMNLWWVIYAVQTELWGLLPVSSIATVFYLVMWGQYLGIVGRSVWGDLLLGAAVVGAAPLIALLVGGWTAAGVVIGLTYSVQFVPAAYSALRTARPDGVSPVTWSMALVEALIWLAYGWSRGDAALVIGGTGGATSASVILIRLWFANVRSH